MRRLILILILIVQPSLVYANDALNIINKVKDTVSDLTEARAERSSNLGNRTTANQNRNENIDQTINIEEYVAKTQDGLESILPFGNENIALVNQDPNLRDPFNMSGQTARKSTGGGFGFGTSFLPNTVTKKVPKLKLRGVINAESKRPEDLLALLEVNNQEVYMVRIGDEISYDPGNPASAIKIMSITRLSIKVQVGNLGNVLIIR